MSRKSVPFGANPKPEPAAPAAEEWVRHRAPGKKKRLTFAIPAELHLRMKLACVRRGTSMVEELEALLEKHYPSEDPAALPRPRTSAGAPPGGVSRPPGSQESRKTARQGDRTAEQQRPGEAAARSPDPAARQEEEGS